MILALALAALGSLVGYWPLSLVFGTALLFVMNFFRDPERVAEGGPKAMISPADGRVVEIATVEESAHVSGEALKIAIFMNIFDVHVNRAPCESRVEWVRHISGSFINAVRASAGLENERTLVALRDRAGRPVLVKQIAGLIARRIVCPIKEGERLGQGQRFGMIKFGSRVEVFVPKGDDFTVGVRLGQNVYAGRTVLGEWQ